MGRDECGEPVDARSKTTDGEIALWINSKPEMVTVVEDMGTVAVADPRTVVFAGARL